MDKIISEVEKNGSDVWLSSDASKFLGKDKDLNMKLLEIFLMFGLTQVLLMHLF